mmetsp:Transcript_13895/g.34045  ORF Transcript_13895/g.34045 Transcript_13895/m.34045 type:complete len:200 (+) Transcript_13895:1057-1656(+)
MPANELLPVLSTHSMRSRMQTALASPTQNNRTPEKHHPPWLIAPGRNRIPVPTKLFSNSKTVETVPNVPPACSSWHWPLSSLNVIPNTLWKYPSRLSRRKSTFRSLSQEIGMSARPTPRFSASSRRKARRKPPGCFSFAPPPGLVVDERPLGSLFSRLIGNLSVATSDNRWRWRSATVQSGLGPSSMDRATKNKHNAAP